jgi:chemotaxis protein methyltransferase CheR
MLKINAPEYVLMTRYIEEHCGIHLEKDKEYLIESRLSDLMAETGCRSFQEFHFKARTDPTGQLRDRIIDAMTTNETSWFRDGSVWEYLETAAVPDLLGRATRTGTVRIWSAAAATGQEAYSLLMLLDEAARRRGTPSLLDRVEILATDISTTALATAVAGRYDAIAVNRGLPEEKRRKYFTQEGPSWVFDERLRSRVRFKKFNLQDPFIFPYRFDLILCRYVSIYFSESFKRAMFARLADVLKPGGALILGATESLREFSDEFDITYYKSAVINTKKISGLKHPGKAREMGYGYG